jgi:hypothetical protein
MTHACVANGDDGTGAQTCPASQSAGPAGVAGAHARATCCHVGGDFVATPPLAPQVPPAGSGAATVTPKVPSGVA